MQRWKDRVALVTGASVGIGAAIAAELVRCARDVDKIQKLAAECQSSAFAGVLVPFRCDLTNEEEILSMFAAIKAEHKGVDVCINNAGLAHPQSLLSGKTSSWKNMMDVNVLALSICTHEAYQSMKERNVDDGHIIHVNSLCGHRLIKFADLQFYTATKYAVTALTEALKQELRGEKFLMVNPDLFFSSFYYLCTQTAVEAVDVANAVIYVLGAPPHVQVCDIFSKPVILLVDYILAYVRY
uniref:Dehydrogenase/reductase SDR family member 11 n=1 Tax=Gouania willdenowi TaxID=441366 RepID=A0A8C5GUY6_GOUWI